MSARNPEEKGYWRYAGEIQEPRGSVYECGVCFALVADASKDKHSAYHRPHNSPRVWCEGATEPEYVSSVFDKDHDEWVRGEDGRWRTRSTWCDESFLWIYLLSQWGPLTEVVEEAGR